MLQDLQRVYLKSLKNTFKKIGKNPIVLIMPILFSLATNGFYLLYTLFLGGTILDGIIFAIVEALFLSCYFALMSDLIYYDRMSLKYFSSNFTKYFRQVYSVFFIIFIASIIFGQTLASSLGLTPYYVISLILYLGFNPLAEEVYIKGNYHINAFEDAFSFMRDNFIHWIIPLVIYLAIGYGIGAVQIPGITISDLIYIPTGYFDFSLPAGNIETWSVLRAAGGSILFTVLFSIISAIYAVFRGCLFRILDGSSMRKRSYGWYND